jgi:hypothetical protein
LEDITKDKKRLKREHVEQWAELRSQGHGINDFSKEKIGNVWLKDYSLLKPSRFIDTIRLRTNTFGTRVVLACADKKISTLCRKCQSQPETMGHILGACQSIKSLRIKRHDGVKMLIANKLQRNNEIFVEPPKVRTGTANTLLGRK